MLTSCLFPTVRTPYAYNSAKSLPVSQTATVWGSAEKAELAFIKIDGQRLPSRGGRGAPLSLSLAPGNYALETELTIYGVGSGEAAIDISVEAGHTYQLAHRISSDRAGFSLELIDMGTSKSCHFEPHDRIGGYARLVCKDN